ncbi:MAG: hypothetical protein NC395_09150 [Prevotella sp.]|nr:hypothetical protein [Prevotella sp.]
MNICVNCGMKYGDDGCFCPYCDERYGTAAAENDVISAEGLPPYREEFPAVGETCVKQESFSANRDRIFERNIRLAARENVLPKIEVRTVYKPVVPLAEIGKNGAAIPYKPPNPIVQRLNGMRKNLSAKALSKTAKRTASVTAAVLVPLAIVGISWFETSDVYNDYQYHKRLEKYGLSEEFTLKSYNGLEMKFTNCYESTDGLYTYDFEFENTSDEDIRYFWNEFTDQYNDGIYKMNIYYPKEQNHAHVNLRKPVYDGYNVSYIDSIDDETHTPPCVHPGDTAVGTVMFEY